MGINAPSLYAAFGDKERLFREVVERYEARAGTATANVLNMAPTARDAVAGFLDQAARTLADEAHPPGCLVVLSAAV